MLENICSKKVAYLIGYLAGDGSYENGNGKRTDRLSVTTTDKETMDWMIETFNLPEETRVVRKNNVALGIYATKDAYVKTFPTSYSGEFNKFGILCRKTDRMIHNINKSDMKYWLLGFLDSDGMISWSERKDRNRIAAKVCFTHPSFKLLERIQTFLIDELSIPSSIKPKGTEKCFVLSFSKISDVKRFGDYVYSDKLAIVLKRKYSKYLELLNQIDVRVEEGSMYPKEFMQSPEYGAIVGTYSKYVFITPDGKEFPSASMAAKNTGEDRSTLSRRCRMNQKGYSSREKTESEKLDFDKYVKRKVKQLFQEWLENNQIYN